jgi:hypothetical protein
MKAIGSFSARRDGGDTVRNINGNDAAHHVRLDGSETDVSPMCRACLVYAVAPSG